MATFTLDTLNELDPPSLKEKSTRVSIFDSIVCAYMEAREKREEHNKSLRKKN